MEFINFANSRKVRPENKNNVANKTGERRCLQKSLRHVMLIAQILGQFPLNGIARDEAKYLQFKWRSPKVLYTTLFAGSTVTVIVAVVLLIFKNGTDIFVVDDLVYYSYMLLASIDFTRLARRWPGLMKEWAAVESTMAPQYGWPERHDFRINLLTIVLMCITTVVYALKIITYAYTTLQRCKRRDRFFHYFFAKKSFPHIFEVVAYSGWTAAWMQIVDVYMTYLWTFLDLFIIVISTSLALRFAQITDRLQAIDEETVTRRSDAKTVTERLSSSPFQTKLQTTWKSIRRDYNRLCRLCKRLDDCISSIVLLSYAGNLFFILIQLFNSLRPTRNNDLEKIYFFVSFAFMIVRVIVVSLYGGWINDESKRPLIRLNTIRTYNVEIRRFCQQIGFDAVALTGKNFFVVTRGLILNIAGAIVTYELVLIQFNENLLKEVDGNSTIKAGEDCL